MLSTVLTLVKATMDYFMFVWLCCLIQIIVASSGSLLHDCTDGVLDAEGANLIGLASVTVIILALAKRRQKRERKRRSRWMCPTLRRRLDYGPEDMLAGYVEDDTDPRTGEVNVQGRRFRNFTRMSPTDFDHLVELIIICVIII